MTNRAVPYPEIGAIYKHYKGGKYKVLTLAKHTETEETLVIYKSIHFGSIHARPLEQWFETITTGGMLKQRIQRFSLHK